MLRVHFTKQSQLGQLSEAALEDLKKSGLSDETIGRMGILPLTEETFKNFVGRSLIEKSTRVPIVLDGYVIPYKHVPSFGRVKVLKWNERSAYYQERKGNLPKYLQKGSQHTDTPVHAYVLDLEKVKSPKSVYVITEGEKKTAKLQQELEKLETDYLKYASIGLGGVWNWNEAVFEEIGASFRDRAVYLCFDADAVYNPNVAKAELVLYSFLLSRGARKVLSLTWSADEGKGIDDYLVGKGAPEEALRELLKEAISPVEKYKETLTLESVVGALSTHLEKLPDFLTEEIRKAYKVGKREIRKLFKQKAEEQLRKLEDKLKEREKEELLSVYKRLFGIDFIPQFPEGFEKREGQLLCKGESICELFVVKELLENADEIDKGYAVILRFVSGKEVRVTQNVLSSSKLLCSYLNKERVEISEREAKKVQDYIVKFVRLNKKKIKRSYYSTRIGWGNIDGEEVYIHPTTSGIEVIQNRDVEGKIGSAGEKNEELEVIRKLAKDYPYSFFVWVMGVSASILYPVLGEDCNIIVYLQGETGSGKTTSIKTAVSFYGSPLLKRSFSFTEGGFEGFVSFLKDFPIHLEEVKEIDRNPQRRAEKFIDFVYRFVGGVGKTRMNINLELNKVATYRGLIFTSSEIGIDEILSYSSDSYYEGLFRRIFVVPVEREKFKGESLARVVSPLYEHHGNLLKDWIEHFQKNREQIVKKFRERELDFSEGYKLDAKVRRFLALVSVVMEEVGELFCIETFNVWDILEEIAEFNEKLYKDYILGDSSSLLERVEEFIDASSLETVIEEEDAMGRVKLTLKENKRNFLVYRRVQREEGEIVEEKTYLTSEGLKELAKKMGMGRKLLVKKLLEAGILEENYSRNGREERALREKVTVLCLGKRFNLYPINLQKALEEVGEF